MRSVCTWLCMCVHALKHKGEGEKAEGACCAAGRRACSAGVVGSNVWDVGTFWEAPAKCKSSLQVLCQVPIV